MKIKSFIIGASIAAYFLFATSCGGGSNNASDTGNTKNADSLNTLPPSNGREPNAARPTDTGSSTMSDTMKKTDTMMHH